MKNNPKVLITGANGFLGKYICGALENLYDIETLGRENATYAVDLKSASIDFHSTFDLVVHAAGKAHSIPNTPAEKAEFHEVNVGGTECLLKSLERAPTLPSAFVFISSVAVYGLECGVLINEHAPLAAEDPYGKSKIRAEQLVEAWCNEHNVTCSILRLPLLAGTNPPGNLSTMIKGIKGGYYFNIESGSAKKSMVLAEDVANIIVKASSIGGIYNLTDGHHPSFEELSKIIAQQLDRKGEQFNMPIGFARVLGRVGDLLGKAFPLNTKTVRKMTSDLTFDDSLARTMLGWNPSPVLRQLQIK